MITTSRRACRLALVTALVILAAACGGGGGGSTPTTAAVTESNAPTASSAPSTTPATTVATTTAATTRPTSTTTPPTTTPPVPPLPAGARFLGPPIEWSGPLGAFRDGDTWWAVGTVPSDTTEYCISQIGCRPSANPVVYRSSNGETFESTLIDDVGTFPGARGEGALRALEPFALATSDVGTVIVGGANHPPPTPGGLSIATSIRAALWYSADDASWERIDMEAVLGGADGELFDVVDTEDGFVAVGRVVEDVGGSQPARGLVLRSTDGRVWEEAARLVKEYTFELEQVFVVGDELFAVGREHICDANRDDFSANVPGAGLVSVLRSSDGGTTWTDVDLAAAGVRDALVRPADAAECEANDGHKPEWVPELGFVDVIADHLVVTSAAWERIATTADGDEWTTATLEGALSTYPSGSGRVDHFAHRLSSDGSWWFVTYYERPRIAQDRPDSTDFQPRTWRSGDGGVTWDPLPPAPRIAIEELVDPDAFFRQLPWQSAFVDGPDGSVVLVIPSPAQGHPAYRSDPGG